MSRCIADLVRVARLPRQLVNNTTGQRETFKRRPAAKLVLSALADDVQDDNIRDTGNAVVWTAVRTLADESEIGSRTVDVCLATLRAAGFISEHAPPRQHLPRTWKLNLHVIAETVDRDTLNVLLTQRHAAPLRAVLALAFSDPQHAATLNYKSDQTDPQHAATLTAAIDSTARPPDPQNLRSGSQNLYPDPQNLRSGSQHVADERTYVQEQVQELSAAAAPHDSQATATTTTSDASTSRAPLKYIAKAKEPNGDNFKPIRELAVAILHEHPDYRRADQEGAFIDAVKGACAGETHIDYGNDPAVPHDVVHRACAAAVARWVIEHTPDSSSAGSRRRRAATKSKPLAAIAAVVWGKLPDSGRLLL